MTWLLRNHSFRTRCEDAVGLRAGALTAVLGGLAAERTATVASKATLNRFDELVEASTNDEVLEFAQRIFDELGGRSENSAQAVWFSDRDRDTVNETFTFVHAAEDIVPTFSKNTRIRAARDQVAKACRWMDKVVEERGTEEPDETRPAVVSHGAAYWRRQRKLRATEKRAAAKLVDSIDFSKDAVLAAFQAAAAATGGVLQAKDVALMLCPAAEPSDTPGRQQVINKVGAVIRKLAVDGAVIKASDASYDERRTCRYALPGGADA